MAHDQVHEQLNAIVKGDGGAIGLIENESASVKKMDGCWSRNSQNLDRLRRQAAILNSSFRQEAIV